MIDIHTHILWGLDDGANTIEDSLEMCRIAYRDGIRTIVATPHTLNAHYQNDRPSILARVRELNEVISNQLLVNSSALSYQSSVTSSDNESPSPNPKSTIRILPGADVHLCDQTIPQLDCGKVTTLGDRGKHILLEFPFHAIPYGAEEVLFQLITKGIIPIISHPERNMEVAQNPDRYHEMIRMGCLGQLTAMSLTDGFGLEVRRFAEKLLAKRLVHLIASDAHSTDRRPPVLSDAVHAATRIVGQKEALRMVSEYPQAILEGRRLDFQLMQKKLLVISY